MGTGGLANRWAAAIFIDPISGDCGSGFHNLSPSATDPAQSFRFEDAGNGFFYIRTLAGLYATVSEATGVASSAGGTFGLKQDRKYAAGSVGANNLDLQRWKFASSSITVINADNYAISCAAIPGKVLQPTGGSTASGAAVVLGDPAVSHSPILTPNPWSVTSPMLPASGLAPT